MKRYFSLILLGAILAPSFVLAETVVRVGDAIVVDETQVVEGDYYFSVGPFGNTTMSGTIAGDMFALGGSVTANGTIEEDLMIMSGVSQLHASVTDDVRLLTGEAIVAESIGGDLFVLAGSLKILSTAKIGGNVYFFGGSAVIDGLVEGSVFGTMERLRIDGPVGGNVEVSSYESVTLGSKASVTGDVNYTSLSPLVRAPEAVIEGRVNERSTKESSKQESARSALIPLFIILFAALSLYLLFRRELEVVYARIEDSYPRAALVGLSVMILGPVASILLMVTVLGFIVGLAGFAATVILLSVGYALSGVMFGAVLSKLLTKKSKISWLWITIGTTSLYAMGFIPVIGPVIVLGFYAVTVGGLTFSLYKQLS